MLDFKNRPPGQPHPACRGRQTPSCPASSRAVQEAVGRPRPRPPPAGLGASRGGGLVRRSGRDCGGREGERGEGRREGGGREGGGKERGGGGHEPRRMMGIVRSKIMLPSRLFASDGLLRPQDGSKMAQEGPKRSPRGAQEGPKSAQERPKSALRGPQKAHLKAPTGGGLIESALFFDRWLPRWPQEAPRRPQETSKTPPRCPQEAPKSPQ